MSVPALHELLRPSVRGAGPYVPGISAAEVKARYGRRDLLRLNWNENLLGPLPGVLEEVAADLGSAWAYPEEAYAQLIKAIAGWTGADPDQVILGHGIQALTLAVIAAVVQERDAVVIPAPTYGLYAQACAVAGARIVRVGSGDTLALHLDAIAAAARDHRAKLVWICDPNNPTGLRLEARGWSAFLDALPEECIAVADEAYHDYIAPADRIDRLADIRAGRPVIALRTFSKIFGLAGLRLGYMLVPPSLAPHINAVQEPFNVNRAALSAGISSLRRTDRLPGRREQVCRARERLVAPLAGRAVRALESDANFVLLELRDDDRRIADTLARDGILIRPGTEFGLPGFVRVTTAEEELMDTVGTRIADSLRR